MSFKRNRTAAQTKKKTRSFLKLKCWAYAIVTDVDQFEPAIRSKIMNHFVGGEKTSQQEPHHSFQTPILRLRQQ